MSETYSPAALEPTLPASAGTPEMPGPAKDAAEIAPALGPEPLSRVSAASLPAASNAVASNSVGMAPQGDEAPYLWLRRGDQAFVALFAACGLLLLGWQAIRIAGWHRPLVEIERLPARQYEFRVDINRANWIEWAQLDGIGEILAKRIVDDRTERGPFRSIDDVQRVRGIGSKKLDQIRPWIEYSEPSR